MSESTEPIDSDDFVHATVATLVWLAIGIALDVYLIIRRKKRLISDVFRTKPGRIGLGIFWLHIYRRLGRVDPFSFVGDKLNTRMVTQSPTVVVGGLTENAHVSK